MLRIEFLAEIAGGGVPDQGGELNQQRAVEVVVLADLRDVFGGGIGTGDRDREVARQPGEVEADAQHGQTDQQGYHDPAREELQHRSTLQFDGGDRQWGVAGADVAASAALDGAPSR
jgi:hypothetical protein